MVRISGAGPDAFFYVGKTGTRVRDANRIGIKLEYPEGSSDPLKEFTGQTVTLDLPPNVKTSEIGW